MKKFLSAVLATAMIASMGAVAFATQPSDGVVLSESGGASKNILKEVSMAGTNATHKVGAPDGDDITVKVDDKKAYFPVVSMAGPYGYYSDDKVLFDATQRKNQSIGTGTYDLYCAPIEYGDTAYYALLQYVPEISGASGLPDNYTKFAEATHDGKKISESAFTNNGWLTVVTESETVSSLKIKQDWEEGKDLVKSVSIVKKKVCNEESTLSADFEYSGDSSSDDPKKPYPTLDLLKLSQFGMEKDMYCYFLAITYEKSTSVNDADVCGTVTLSKSKDPSVDKIDIDLEVNVDWENSWRPSSVTPDLDVTGNISLEADKNYALKFSCDDEIDIEFDDDSVFTVDVSGQSKILFNYNTDYISKIAAKYPYAELNFWNGNGAKFNRVGEMFLSCEDLTGTQFLYQVTSDGKLAEVPGAEWDDSDEGFYFNTRVLGSYVISDMELDVAAEKEETESGSTVVTTPIVTNPSTGAIA